MVTASEWKPPPSWSADTITVGFRTRAEALPGHRAHEALDLRLVVVIVHAGPDERVEAAGGQIQARGARLRVRDVDVHGTEPRAGRLRRLAGLQKGDDPASLRAQVVHGHTRHLRELAPPQRRERLDSRLDRVHTEIQRVADGDRESDLAGHVPLPVLDAAGILADHVG